MKIRTLVAPAKAGAQVGGFPPFGKLRAGLAREWHQSGNFQESATKGLLFFARRDETRP
jgi:hypothetical protein